MREEEKKAVIVVSHGSKNPKASEQFYSFIANIKERKKNIRVEGAFFQLANPEIIDRIEQLVGEGYRKIFLVPFFLMHGTHVAEDIPALVATLEKRFSEIKFVTGDILYPDDRLVEIVSDRIEEVAQ